MGKRLVTMFCGHKILGNTSAQQYCHKTCLGYHDKRSKKAKPAPKKRVVTKKPYIPSSSNLWDQAKSYQRADGYTMLYFRDPESGHRYDRSQHTVIWERAYGIRVAKNNCLHHLNQIKNDNRPENLICLPKSLHKSMHARLDKLSKMELPPVKFNIERHAIIQEFIGKASELLERQIIWKGLPSQQASEEVEDEGL